METVTLRAHTSAEGKLLLDLPRAMGDADVDVTVTRRPKDEVLRDALGWPIGFKERFFGAFPDAPDEPEELPLNEPRF
ncbi:hypothetical protein BH11ARM2_BH11ARM2_10780 [soil metagenome]